jgi:hypothetical protein
MIRQTFPASPATPRISAPSRRRSVTVIGDPFYLNAQALTAVKNEAATV